MDWSKDNMKTKLLVYPEGMMRSGLNGNNAMRWQSKFGSIVATAYEDFTTDGMNERGLAAHILWLDESNYGATDSERPAMSVMIWPQFYLDNFTTVDEAVKYTEQHPFQLAPFYHTGLKQWIKVHLALEDANGDSAIIEYIDGVAHIYHHPTYTVLTNSPTYDKHLQDLKTLQSTHAGFGDAPLPGTTNSPDRFLRASFYAARLSPLKTSRHALMQLQSIINNVAQPYGKKSPERRGISPTLWRSFADLSNQVYYFNFSTSLNTIWVPIKNMNLRPGAPVLSYDLANDSDASGDVSGNFVPLS
jgi:choloylglycine hydrolase